MRLLLAWSLLTASSAFAPTWGTNRAAITDLQSAVAKEQEKTKVPKFDFPLDEEEDATWPVYTNAKAPALSADEINRRHAAALEKMREKDKKSPMLKKEDLKVLYEDKHIVVIDKPAGVLCVPTKETNNALSTSVFNAFGCESGVMDRMVVHRLGMDTSGVVVFAKNEDALRGLNARFRTRKVRRKYEALLCGHVESDVGEMTFPLMRDYEHPPYQRVSTNELQNALIGLTAEDIGRKMLQWEKESITKYEVISREELNGLPVTRVLLTSGSGRTHQLNCHCAAFGHPIVGDRVYGIDGEAAPHGGLANTGADEALQKKIAESLGPDAATCSHAKMISFKHPVTKEYVVFETPAPF